MSRRCLILYSSYAGNTEKIAARFGSTFEKNGWTCDFVKIRKKAEDILHPPLDIESYEFLCLGPGSAHTSRTTRR